MTSEIDVSKTNEFQRRRKLRLQQVREQSKDIAKKIRQRAKVEKLRNVINLDAKKEQQYFELQDKLVGRLEQLHSHSLQNVGVGHKNASNLKEAENEHKKDLSKSRGREAVAELRKRKQEKLDEQKKILDRKLQARETANELSREKGTVVAKALSSKSIENLQSNNIDICNDRIEKDCQTDSQKGMINSDNPKNDMGTQWEVDEFSKEWAPAVPSLSLPKDDKDSCKDSGHNAEKSDKNKRINLFALSDEMPTSLRGGLSSVQTDIPSVKPSMTLISEYLLSRSLRLRENNPVVSTKKSDDLQGIKQTILRSRASRPDGNVANNVCHVLDKQLIPVPSWKAEDNNSFYCYCHRHKHVPIKHNPFNHSEVSPKPMMGFIQKQSKLYNTPVSGKSDQSKGAQDITLEKKNSVTMYNHSTRDTRDIAYNNDAFVIRELNTADDAYTKALKETSMINDLQNKELERKKEDMRNKVAMTKEKVDKEYKDTLAFLNSLSKDTTSRAQKIAHMDAGRQQMRLEKQQRRMQDEFKKIERECSKRSCKHSKTQLTTLDRSRSKSRSPDKINYVDNVLPRNFQYDWMPVPESDGNLAVHTIASTKNPKSSNTVKFNDVDTYHEYRSRHKHTPPTKDVSKDRQKKRIIETVILQQNSNETTDASVTSDASTDEQTINNKNKTNKDILDDPRLSDGDRIVIYKILDSKRDKRSTADKKSKAINKIFKSLSSVENGDASTTRKSMSSEKVQTVQVNETDSQEHKQTALENLSEGIYRVNENGDNVASMYFTDKNQTSCSCKQERTTSSCTKCTKNQSGSEQINTESERITSRYQHPCSGCKCACSNTNNAQASTATSTSSFQTAANDKGANGLSDGGFLKAMDGGDQDTGKFYIGASGFLKDDKYEVVIQLKKKDTQTIESKSQEVNVNIAEEEPTSTKNLSKVNTEVQSSFRNNLKECAAQTSINTESAIGNDSLSRSKSEPVITNLSPAPNLNITHNKLIGEQNKRPDARVVKDTITRDSFTMPSNVAKPEQISRPATSTYTQTSFSSPNSRPVFLHMTSSTSTAYMSPPELIMPQHLKQTRTSSYKDELRSKRCEKYDPDCIKVHKRCKGKHSKSKLREKSRKCRHMCSTTDTPPNTAHSYDYGSWSENTESEMLQQKSRSGTCRRVQKHKNRFTMHRSSSKSSVRDAVLTNKNIHKLYHLRPLTSNKNCFNPVVKQYVNKLLSLNKESLKAIQVVNQDCSAVDTPGSSIINNALNIGDKFTPLQNKISLQQIKLMLEQHIMKEQANKYQPNSEMSTEMQQKNGLKLPRRKQIHKVKSLNISKRLLKNKQDIKKQAPVQKTVQPESSSSSMKEPLSPKRTYKDETDFIKQAQHRRQSSSTSSTTDMSNNRKGDSRVSKHALKSAEVPVQPILHYSSDGTYRSNELYKLRPRRPTLTSASSESIRRGNGTKNNSQILPTDISTQTSGIDSEINFMKLAENKLQNMEKIADLTEKCTKRLSNLAKVLDEVRKNKSMVYSHISTSDSTSDSEPKNITTNERQHVLPGDVTSDLAPNPAFPDKKRDDDNHYFVPLLKDIPKPLSPSTLSLSTISEKSIIPQTISCTDQTKNKSRPPPALSRVNLKKGQDFQAVPHELSTVMEVDSPMSMKHKNQSSCREFIQEETSNNKFEQIDKMNKKGESQPKFDSDPDLLHSKTNSVKHQSSDSGDHQRFQIMDMKLFNDIMLKPFLSVQEYAKQCDLRIDEGSNMEDVLKDEPIQEDLSSLHSDGSLPDVISELLKRKIITEPFKFDTGSHVNTTSMSSESSLSILALSKIRQERKSSKGLFINKENIGENSETLSISSNPDLENAFQKLGMGWASSTLKKTKERLALSSSSNTSTSSVGRLKFKSYNRDIPITTTTESTVSEHNNNPCMKSQQSKHVIDISKNVEQQTSLINSMTVKEFLTNELAKKITFANKSSRRNDEDFVSLYETKMPEDLKNTSEIGEHESTIASQSNNRARTSTPVQIFKSTTYQSTSSTNTSNGLFSNADELSSVKVTSNSIRNHSTSDKDDLTIPNYSLKRKGLSDCSKSE